MVRRVSEKQRREKEVGREIKRERKIETEKEKKKIRGRKELEATSRS